MCIALQATLEDDRLLSGHMPQPQEWLRAWRIARDPRSWQAAERDDATPNFICQIRTLAVQRRSWKALCVTMAEVVQQSSFNRTSVFLCATTLQLETSAVPVKLAAFAKTRDISHFTPRGQSTGTCSLLTHLASLGTAHMSLR